MLGSAFRWMCTLCLTCGVVACQDVDRDPPVDGLGFGTHLVDFHISLDDLIDATVRQAAALR